ncbi:MAG: hypothetical protein AAF824_03885 [Bacteroidota bacterium]
MNQNLFMAIGYWTLFAVNGLAGIGFAMLFPDTLPEELRQDLFQLHFSVSIMELLSCILGRITKAIRQPDGVGRAWILSLGSYLFGLILIVWKAPAIWALLVGNFFLLIGGFQLGKRLGKAFYNCKRKSDQHS